MDSDLIRVVLTFRDELQEHFEAAAVELGFEIFESCPEPDGTGWIAVNVSPHQVDGVVASFRQMGMDFEVATALAPRYEHLWQGLTEPQLIGERLAIAPPGDWAFEGRRVITIDPGLSFGSGSHATTQMLLEWLEEDTPRESLLDVGCGSGVLALAARALGTEKVVGFDIDEGAVQLAGQNAAANQLEIDWRVGRVAEVPGRFECVVANLLAAILTEEWQALVGKVQEGGSLLVSGILEEQVSEFLKSVAAKPVYSKSREGWFAMRFVF
jgi:ribosomal protein L11 methyltransferase